MENNYYKEIMVNYYLIIILILFLVVYTVINYSIIKDGNIYGGNIPKTVIITGIIFLVLYIFLTWDDEEEEELIVIPKYRIINKINIKENEPKESIKKEIVVPAISEDIDAVKDIKVENSNIFIPQKNKSKFGIKF